MAVTPTPMVLINGRGLRCDAAALETEPLAIRGFTIRWGRDEYMNPGVEPASTTITVVDASGEWARNIRTSVAIGSPVQIQWSATSPGGSRIGPVVMFRGRVSHISAQPANWELADGRRPWIIELTAPDRTADFGNALAGPAPWPAETMVERAIKIRDLGLAAGSEISEVYFWPGYVDSPVSPLEVNGKSGLELLGALYASMGNDSYAFDPDENVIRQAIRLAQPVTVHLGSFDDNLGAVLPVANDVVVDGKTYPGVGLGGCELIGHPSIEATAASELNYLECRWKDRTNDHNDWVTHISMVEAGDGRRTMAWESWLSDGLAIDPTMENVAERAREEGRRPTPPAVQNPWSFSFVTERMARFMLQCWENPRMAFISGSLAYQWLMNGDPGYPPVVAPIGGATTWDPARGWQARLNVHWVFKNTPAAAGATWKSLEQVKTTSTAPSVPWWWSLVGLPTPPPVTTGSRTPERDMTWGDPSSGSGYRFAESVTWGDMQHVPTAGAQIKDHLS